MKFLAVGNAIDGKLIEFMFWKKRNQPITSIYSIREWI